ncbi:alcohol dehydrogenase catalytic domain-containing protein [candidate division NPL-UPA2 bacterium]|nr:alcohol dehydrogenase catalytic domain-containing protein [candidate division NPL-UPA2 bacterium]
MNYNIPETQHAVQLIGPDELILNTAKRVYSPGRHQILCRVEAVGLCFSDLKLLKQFSGHARKSAVISGIDAEILKEIPSYVPQDAPTVPGHETVVRISAVGHEVKNFRPGERYLVQADYRWLLTANANAAFGYNFEGALQEYVLMDERVITSPEGNSMLIPASEELSASAIALVEPWGCVENSYAAKERLTLKAGGKMLVVAEREVFRDVLSNFLKSYGKPAQITYLGQLSSPAGLDVPLKQIMSTVKHTHSQRQCRRQPKAAEGSARRAGSTAKQYWPKAGISELEDGSYDDVIYFGSCPETVEELFSKVAAHGLFNIVLCGGHLGRTVVSAIGRVHYGGIRIVGTTGSDPAMSMENIPVSGEIRKGDRINVIGAGGPMGVMHVIRNICQGVQGITIFAGEINEERLTALNRIASPLTEKHKVSYRPYNPSKDSLEEKFDYVALMAPVPDLVAQSVQRANNGAIINIFAGIPPQVTARIDLDTYLKKELYFMGTSGSVLEDMKRVLAKVEKGRLNTNLSVAAVCGLEGAVEGVRAMEKHLVAGKIIVYPSCKGLGLVTLENLKKEIPQVSECLINGLWNGQAEKTLLKMYQ